MGEEDEEDCSEFVAELEEDEYEEDLYGISAFSDELEEPLC